MKPHAHTHAHIFKHANTNLSWKSGHRKHLTLREREQKTAGIKEKCLKPDTASFLPCTVAYEVHINSLRIDAAWFAITLYLLTALKEHIFRQNPNWGMQRTLERWREDTSHSPEYHQGESPAGLAHDSMLSQWTLMKTLSSSGESLITPSFLPPLQQKPNAFCFECLVATSPYPIPWVYKCSPACTCPMLPGAIFSCPNRLFLWQWSL